MAGRGAVCSHEQRSGRTDENIAVQPHALEHGGQQPQLSERGGGPVHFPVSRDKGAGPSIGRHGSSSAYPFGTLSKVADHCEAELTGKALLAHRVLPIMQRN